MLNCLIYKKKVTIFANKHFSSGMATHNIRGKTGEDEAVAYLQRQGISVLHRNWRSGHKELDIVGREGDELVVVEVKSRRNTLFGQPENAIDNRKIRRIVAATDAYLKRFAIDLPVRFDVVTVIGDQPPYRIEHIREAFFPPLWN